MHLDDMTSACRIPVPPARLKSSKLLQRRGFRYNELAFQVPLDYRVPDGDCITVTARVVYDYVAAETADDRVQTLACDLPAAQLERKPMVVYLCGGPGSSNPPDALASINHHYLGGGSNILYMDYRGTGSSMALRADTLRHKSLAEQARLVQLCQPDNIARDHEAVRQALHPDLTEWNLVGQSYGGWVALSYLSFYSREAAAGRPTIGHVLLFGGMAPIGVDVDRVYGHTYDRIVALADAFYAQFAEDEQHVQDILAFILRSRGTIAMPRGGTLTTSRFLCLGRTLGTTDGFGKVHGEIAKCIADIHARGALSSATKTSIEAWIRFEDRPLYGLLQEAIYLAPGQAARWSADRVARARPEFWHLCHSDDDLLAILACKDRLHRQHRRGRIYLTAEHVYPSHYDAFAALVPLKGLAAFLADSPAWPQLFDMRQLAANTVPTAVLLYKRDPFVITALGAAVAARIGRLVLHIEDELMHTALKDRTSQVLPKLTQMLQELMASGADKSSR